ncbi:hypothetical protein L0P56_12880, partial [Anaerosalibacter bizertensis]|nr:hypothetical protein [Anaerosalibacter bizertensis]
KLDIFLINIVKRGDNMKKNKKRILTIFFILIFCSILVFIISRYGLDHSVIIFKRIINLFKL